ncbi:UNVERIFIED_CONTAM: hypothetical protein K2H54_074102 [Gekko kuhli]
MRIYFFRFFRRDHCEDLRRSKRFAGYSAKDCVHNAKVILALRILMAPIPIALLLASMAVFCSYPINEERRKEIRVEMEASSRRGQTDSPESDAT